MSAAPGETSRPGAAAFPWDEAMAAGLGMLGLSSRQFWAMSPREFARAISPFVRPAGEPIARPALEALMRLFPDR